MISNDESINDIPLYMPRSIGSTRPNKTGSWRVVKPFYDFKTAPCGATCPAGEDIPRIEMHVANKNFEQAFDTILLENPFPAICGRVCFHNCEKACNRKNFDEPLAINSLERFIGDKFIEKKQTPYADKSDVSKLAKKDQKIAIIGSGPAGLAFAYFMTILGYTCTIFEKQDKPGGVLRWGIPSYRLPENILDKEINRIKSLGVTIECNKNIDEKELEVIKDKFDGIFIGSGYGKEMPISISGDLKVTNGLEFLFQNKDNKIIPYKNQEVVAVVGGGNTAIDVARSLKRLGAKPVIVYRRRKQDMPAHITEIETAILEGITIKELVLPTSAKKINDSYELTLQKMKVAEIKEGERAKVVEDGQNTETITIDQIVSAIGAKIEENWQNPDDNNQLIKLSHCQIIEDKKPVIFGGDITTPSKSVTDAIGSGKQAAMALDTMFTQGKDKVADKLDECQIGNGTSLSMETYTGLRPSVKSKHEMTFEEINTNYFDHGSRITIDEKIPNEYEVDFSEVVSTISQDKALSESKRCCNCGTCNDCDTCKLFCPDMAVITYKGQRYINYDYCKGCGICVVECPRNAMALKEEEI